MRRGAGADIFLRTLDRVRSKVPGITLRTSFIVGFPGETAEDFAILSNFVEQAQFDWMGVFRYSDEEGSSAHSLDCEGSHANSPGIREQRLMELQQQISRRRKAALLGSYR